MIDLSDLVDLLDQDIFEGDGEGIYLPLETAERVVEELRHKENTVAFYEEKQRMLANKEEAIIKPLQARITSLEQKAAIDKKDFDVQLRAEATRAARALAQTEELKLVLKKYQAVYGDVPLDAETYGKLGKPITDMTCENIAETYRTRITFTCADKTKHYFEYSEHLDNKRAIEKELAHEFGTQIYKFRLFQSLFDIKPIKQVEKKQTTKDLYEEIFKDFDSYV